MTTLLLFKKKEKFLKTKMYSSFFSAEKCLFSRDNYLELTSVNCRAVFTTYRVDLLLESGCSNLSEV